MLSEAITSITSGDWPSWLALGFSAYAIFESKNSAGLARFEASKNNIITLMRSLEQSGRKYWCSSPNESVFLSHDIITDCKYISSLINSHFDGRSDAALVFNKFKRILTGGSFQSRTRTPMIPDDSFFDNLRLATEDVISLLLKS